MEGWLILCETCANEIMGSLGIATISYKAKYEEAMSTKDTEITNLTNRLNSIRSAATR